MRTEICESSTSACLEKSSMPLYGIAAVKAGVKLTSRSGCMYETGKRTSGEELERFLESQEEGGKGRETTKKPGSA